MDYLTSKIFNEQEVEFLRTKILSNKEDWKDGRETAGRQAAKVKNNLQLDKKSNISIECSQYVIKKISTNLLISSYCFPKKIHGILFSKSALSQGYGMHVDNAYMKSGRSDISFTIFLSKKTSYLGGELSIQTNQEEHEIKLNAGEIVLYPSTSLHSVKEVTKGERIACVGWIESYISSNEDRNILFGLNSGAQGILAKYGSSPELDLVFQAYNNILRRLGD